ncbi:MAG: hypothetical protein IPM36_16830 [Lewinellaceae bacterium]|nr:hypothetical protein [Lewinellaceae bacterium]
MLFAGATSLQAQCALSIDKVDISGCYYSGGQSLTTIQVEVGWQNPPSGDITVQLQSPSAGTLNRTNFSRRENCHPAGGGLRNSGRCRGRHNHRLVRQ